MAVRNERREEIPRRCAWCERFRVAGAWIEGRRETDVVQAHGAKMTHTICDSCTQRLREHGTSV